MQDISLAKTKSSMYCWLILAVFIALTLAFMLSFYNRAVNEISQNSIVLNNRLELDN